MTQWNKIYKKNQKNYKYYDLNEPHQDMPKISKIFKQKKIKKILDLGCGSGRNLFYLLKKGFELSGIDLAPEGIKQIKQITKNKVDLKIGDVFTTLPYKDNSFDAIISVQVLQHSKKRNIKKAISEIKRILKPGGLIFLTVCGRYSQGKLRYCLITTAKQIAYNTFVPTIGPEKGLTHFIYNKKILLEHYSDFQFLETIPGICYISKIRRL